MQSRKMTMGRLRSASTDHVDVEESPARSSNSDGSAGLASELSPVELTIERSPLRNHVQPGSSMPLGQISSVRVCHEVPERPIFETAQEIAEMMDMSEEEVEEIYERKPRNIRCWMDPKDLIASLLPTPAPSDIEQKSVKIEQCKDFSTEADVSDISKTEPRPSSSEVTPMSMPAPKALVDYGSDFDSDYDDEFDGKITNIVSSEREVPSDEELDEPTRNVVNDIEQGMDDAIDKLLCIPTDFQWTEDYVSFKGAPETFSGPAPGPIRDYDSAYDAFTDIWDNSVIDRIVLETNSYAKQTIDSLKKKGSLKQNSRLHQWHNTDRDEILVLFGVYMLMAIDARTSLHEYWKGGLLDMPKFKSILSFNRYVLLSKFLHFISNDGIGSVEPVMPSKLRKLVPILQHLQEKFSTLYNMEREISFGESLTLSKSRLSWVQAITSKPARFGIKSCELCESSTGYMGGFQIYTGKSDSFANTGISFGTDLGGKAVKVVLELLRGLENRGHCLAMDNFYNSPALARYLKRQGIDCLGKLRVTRRHVPKDIAKVPKDVAKGTIVARHSGDVSILTWKDNREVTIISTFHDAYTFIGSKNSNAVMPACVRDYNNTMGGIDLKDQKLNMYLMERKRGMKWYIKMFKRLMNVSIHNAFVMYIRSLSRRKIPLITHREFRYQLAQSLIEKHRPKQKEIVEAADIDTRLRKDILHPPKVVKDAKARRRCQVCYTSKKIQRKVRTYCSACDAFLCFESDCWVKWHSLSKDFEVKETRGRKRKRV